MKIFLDLFLWLSKRILFLLMILLIGFALLYLKGLFSSYMDSDNELRTLKVEIDTCEKQISQTQEVSDSLNNQISEKLSRLEEEKTLLDIIETKLSDLSKDSSPRQILANLRKKRSELSWFDFIEKSKLDLEISTLETLLLDEQSCNRVLSDIDATLENLKISKDLVIKNLDYYTNNLKSLNDEFIKLNQISLNEAISKRHKYYLSLILVVCAIFFFPLIFKAFNYYVLGWFLSKFAHIKISEDNASSCELISMDKNITLNIEEPFAINEEFVKTYDKSSLNKASKIFFSWKYPFTSYAAGLFLQTLYSKSNADEGAMIEISSKDADDYLILLKLNSSAPFVIYPSHIVGVSDVDTLKIKTHWSIFSLDAWLLGQLRFFTVSGSGHIILKAKGGMKFSKLNTDKGINPKNIIGFDARIPFKAQKTETFLPYLFSKSDFVDLYLKSEDTNEYIYITANSSDISQNVVRRSFEAFLNAIGKLIGI